MTIEELKRALVEVRELCANTCCSKCPIAKRDEAGISYCPLHETEEGVDISSPYDWDVDEWMEDVKDETR